MIPVLTPYFPKEMRKKILKELDSIMESGWVGMGPKVQELEEKWAKYTGAKYAVAVNSCTSALDIAVRIVGFSKYTPVKVSAFTFISSALAPLNAGYEVQFVDINEETLTTHESDIQVMYAGNISGKGKIYDMAHCGGYKHLGLVSCWSFHAVKNLPTGDGGMLTTNDKKLYLRAKALSWCGIDKSTYARNKGKYSWDYNINEPGLKAHMNDMTAVVALEQLKELDKGNLHRKMLAHAYEQYLPKSIKRPYKSSTWHLYTIQVPRRNQLYDYLAENGISCGLHYKPLHFYKFFKNNTPLPVTEKVFKHIISLPIHRKLQVKDVKRICQLISAFYSKKS